MSKLTVATGPTGKPTLFVDGAAVDPTHRLTLPAEVITNVALAYGAYGVSVGRASLAATLAARSTRTKAADKVREAVSERLARLEARTPQPPSMQGDAE